MGMLHELLAVERTKSGAATQVLTETNHKFGKFEFFQGGIKTLRMIEDTPQSQAIEDAAREVRTLPTTVHETLEYALRLWASAEDVIFQKNLSNQRAIADLMFRGTKIASDVPVDELMGLESRLEQIRRTMSIMPTLNAAVSWNADHESGRKGSWVVAEPEIKTKTEKVTTPVVLYPANDKHPAQVEKVTVDKTVGTFTLIQQCGAATSAQKAEVLTVLDDLISEVKQARMRANRVEAATDKIGQTLVNLIMAPFTTNI